MKEIFFFGGDNEGFLGKNARRMMMHLSIPIDEDLQQTLSFFEKVYTYFLGNALYLCLLVLYDCMVNEVFGYMF